MTLELSDITYTFRQSKRAKNLSIRILPNQCVEIVLPVGYSERSGLRFLKKNRSWVLDNINAKGVGDPYKLIQALHLKSIDRHFACQYLHLPEQTCRLSQPLDDVLVFSGKIVDMRCCQPALDKWLKEQAQKFLLPMLKSLSEEMHLHYRQASVRIQKTRWGSCSSHGDISLNARLLYLELALVRYVLIHELCHLQEMNHSANFWRLVERHEPNYRALVQQLKRH